MSTAASSTVDYLCIGSVLMDMRLKLVEDSIEESKEQMSSVFANLEACFDYLRKLQEGINGKAAAAAVSGLDRTLRAMARECLKLGPSQDLMTRKDGALTGSKLCKCRIYALRYDKASCSNILITRSLLSPHFLLNCFVG